MKKISVYNRCLYLSPSGYYRIIQYTNRLKVSTTVHNILQNKIYNLYLKLKKIKILNLLTSPLIYLTMLARVTFFLSKDLLLSKPDIIIISRGLLPKYIPSYILFLLNKFECPFIWDFDDDILLSHEISKKEFNFLCKKSKVIIATHEYLKNKISYLHWNKIKILPTTDGDFSNIDFSHVIEKRKKTFENEIKLVWTGTSGNLINVIMILPYLDLVAEKIFYSQNKKIVLYIISNDHIQIKTNFLDIQNIDWSRQKAIDSICEAHIGIMPLINNEYSLGKGGFKLIQYMAASLPVIGSNVGYNSFIIKDSFGCLIDDLKNYNEWFEYINKISANWNSYLYYSQNSKRNWEDHFNYDENLKFWSDLIEKIA